MARMSDAKLAKMAAEHKKLKNKIKQLEKAAEERQKRIIKELDERGDKAYETGDGTVRISVVSNSNIEYDLGQLKSELNPRQFQMITQRVIDKDRLSTAVQNGKVPVASVDRCSKLSHSRPYIRVTLRDPQE